MKSQWKGLVSSYFTEEGARPGEGTVIPDHMNSRLMVLEPQSPGWTPGPSPQPPSFQHYPSLTMYLIQTLGLVLALSSLDLTAWESMR